MITLIVLILGQDATSAPDANVLKWISQLTVTGILAIGYWQERKERLASDTRERASHDTERAMLERALTIIVEATGALRDVTQVQETLTERAAIPVRPEVSELVSRMDELSRELRSATRPKGE